MIQGFYTGINGIQTHQMAIDVVADNMANVNTNGFRSYRAEFSTLFNKNLNVDNLNSSVDSQIGLGAKIDATTMDTSIGSLLNSERSTDVAIMGKGWFGVASPTGTYYTRDGAFSFNSKNELVTADGHYVLGTNANNTSGGILSPKLDSLALSGVTSQTKLAFPSELTYPTQPTTKASFFGNLTIADETKVVSVKAIDPNSQINTIRLEFTKASPQNPPGIQWNVKATSQSPQQRNQFDPLTGTTVSIPEEIYDTQMGVVSFDESGQLVSSTLSSINNNGQSVAIDLGSGFSGLISSGMNYHLASTSDGKIKGELTSYGINTKGEVIADFTNGEQSVVGSIAVFNFPNEQGLERVGSTRFMESSNSGKPLFFQDANGSYYSNIVNYRLEGSNARVDNALTELIILQRSYEANAKSITTADEMIQKALNMHK